MAATHMDAAAQEVERRRRETLAAMAQGGQAAREAYEQGIAQVGAYRGQAIDSIIGQSSAMAAGPEADAVLRSIAGDPGLRSMQAMSSANARTQADMARQQANLDTFYGGSQAVIPVLRADADRTIAIEREKQAQKERERLEREAGQKSATLSERQAAVRGRVDREVEMLESELAQLQGEQATAKNPRYYKQDAMRDAAKAPDRDPAPIAARKAAIENRLRELEGEKANYTEETRHVRERQVAPEYGFTEDEAYGFFEPETAQERLSRWQAEDKGELYDKTGYTDPNKWADAQDEADWKEFEGVTGLDKKTVTSLASTLKVNPTAVAEVALTDEWAAGIEYLDKALAADDPIDAAEAIDALATEKIVTDPLVLSLLAEMYRNRFVRE